MKIFSTPVTVDSIVAQFNKQLQALGELANAKRSQADSLSELARQSEVQAAACIVEAERAESVQAKIAALVS